MKKGDKLYCVKSFIESVGPTHYTWTAGKSYRITGIDIEGYIIESNSDNVWFENEDWFGVKPEDIKYEDYFITEKEIRKLKLDKINAIWKISICL